MKEPGKKNCLALSSIEDPPVDGYGVIMQRLFLNDEFIPRLYTVIVHFQIIYT